MQAVVQLRGPVNMQGSVVDTLEMLNLHRVNQCALVPRTASYQGMIQKVNDYVAYGEPSVDTISLLLERRAEPVSGDEPVSDTWVRDNTEYDDLRELARALHNEETTLAAEGLSPVLRLHPPRGGHNGIKHPVKEGGDLGKHSREEIDSLLRKMR